MKLSAPKNPNYAATVVKLGSVYPLDGLDNLRGTMIYGNQVLVGKDAQEGDVGLFFGVETALSDEFLGHNNLYRKPEWGNADKNARGFFDQHGRVRCIKFKGNRSEGFFIPLSSLTYLDTSYDSYLSLSVGGTFDELDGHPICHKYVPKRNPGKSCPAKERQAKLIDQILPNQFRFHPDTENLRRNIHKIDPNDVISISDKWHGTSVVISKVLVQRTLPWYERLIQKVGIRIQTSEYGLVYSSRKVVKAVNGVEKTNQHYYGEDIWGVVAKEIEARIPLGYTLYGEIVGYTPQGSPIQGGYHYGCPMGGHRFLVYRVTCTNAEGLPLELSWPQLFDFCEKYGFEMVKELYYGKANRVLAIGGLPEYPQGQAFGSFQDEFLRKLEELYVHDQMCEENNFEVPAEGVVVRIDGLNSCQAFKLKNFLFLENESKLLDKGELDMETQESEDDVHTPLPCL